MILRYQWFIQRLNNIHKVCRMHNMTMVSLDRTRGLAAASAWRRDVAGRGWFDDEAFLGLMRVRGVQCRARYAEAFTVEKSVLDSGSDYSVN
jgi:hypothetical protein